MEKGIIATFDVTCTKCTLYFDEAAFLVLRHGLNSAFVLSSGSFQTCDICSDADYNIGTNVDNRHAGRNPVVMCYKNTNYIYTERKINPRQQLFSRHFVIIILLPTNEVM